MSTDKTIEKMNVKIGMFDEVYKLHALLPGVLLSDRHHVEYLAMRGFLKYHEDWNQLMAVIEKIELFGNRVKIYTGHTTIIRKDGNPVTQVVDKSKISATHKAIYDFITWHNTKQKD